MQVAESHGPALESVQAGFGHHGNHLAKIEITPAGSESPRQRRALGLDVQMDTPTFRESVSDAIRFWEPRRLVYNALLSLIVLFYFFRAYPASKAILTLDSILGLFLLVVLANVAYCAAYLADVFAQWSSYRDLWYRDLWKQYRWVLFAVGMLFAGILTRFIAIGIFWPNSS